MNKGWLELESDPGLFTLLLEDFGVKGVQVEEIYDLQKIIDGPVYGFIFLFRWIEERRSRRKTITEEESFVQDENIVNGLFFAQQEIPNSCATHALLSVLLNCEKVSLGETLTKLKKFSKHMNPQNKGFAIGNMPELARAHNSHARFEPQHLPEKQQGISTTRTMEAFHFVSYVPVNGHLFELDGLKPFPIDHGPWDKGEDWTEKFRRVISDRLGMGTGGSPYHDVRFNLMAVVPDKRQLYEHKLMTLKTNRQIVLEALQQMVKVTTPGLTVGDEDKYLSAVRQGEVIHSTVTVQMPNKEPIVENASHVHSNSTSVSDQLKMSKESVMKLERENTCDSSDTTEINVVDDDEFKSEPSVSDSTDKEVSSSIYSGPSSESTDTASEVGSGFSSPNSTFTASCQNSPQLTDKNSEDMSRMEVDDQEKGVEANSQGQSKTRSKFSSHRAFSPKDLLALLKNVEREIILCETNLKDEIEKRKKYKIDDNRRTHNYDQYIFTFLSMLAEQGHLTDLVEKHATGKKRHGLTMGCLHKGSKQEKRRRTRPKRRR
ncbi:hypothetical protein ScPMuIL_007639 [Solemya velum]